MSSVITGRRLGLAAALTAAIAAAGWVGGQEKSAEPLPQPAVTVRAAPILERRHDDETQDVDIEKLKQRTASTEFSDMFPRRSWQPPAAPASVRRHEPQLPPPLPFVYFGRMLEDGRTVVFLSRQNQSFAVKAGDTIDHSYRVDEISATAIELTYLPLGQRQTLQMGIIN